MAFDFNLNYELRQNKSSVDGKVGNNGVLVVRCKYSQCVYICPNTKILRIGCATLYTEICTREGYSIYNNIDKPYRIITMHSWPQVEHTSTVVTVLATMIFRILNRLEMNPWFV